MPPENPGNEDTLLIEHDGPIAWLTVNRPSAHNALNRAVWRSLAAAIGVLEESTATRVIVVKGAGDKAFISGADIGEFEDVRGDADAARAYDQLSEATWKSLEAVSKPVIAMVNGLCYGGGVSIAVSCDIRFASEAARFAIPALRLGLSYPLAAIERLVRIVGAGVASDILLTGRAIEADEAREIGLIHRVAPDDQLESLVRESAAQMAAGAPLTLAAHKLAIREADEARADRDWDALETAMRRCFDSEDYREGVRAFIEKRPPKFRAC